jgi:uncharacterized membrane protein YgcG
LPDATRAKAQCSWPPPSNPARFFAVDMGNQQPVPVPQAVQPPPTWRQHFRFNISNCKKEFVTEYNTYMADVRIAAGEAWQTPPGSPYRKRHESIQQRMDDHLRDCFQRTVKTSPRAGVGELYDMWEEMLNKDKLYEWLDEMNENGKAAGRAAFGGDGGYGGRAGGGQAGGSGGGHGNHCGGARTAY